MWLLNAVTRKLENFMDDRNVRHKYAILSHTWENEEVLFEDIERPGANEKAGYRKIDFTCQQALSDGLQYVWIDTCCMDKKSSAELSEAINSMYRWYHYAHVCYAYFSDLTHTAQPETRARQLDRISKCRWFSRGWTLQELIAPNNVYFYDSCWNPVLEKTSVSQDLDFLSGLTSIDRSVLENRDRLVHKSIADRLSWASGRETTRLEDQAYCLLGLLDVNMPLLYGEGEKAFIRLQEEVIKTWSRIDHSLLVHRGSEMLATSPAVFSSQPGDSIDAWSLPQRETFELSNLGLRISVLVDEKDEKLRSSEIIVALNCCDKSSPWTRITLKLKRRPHVRHGIDANSQTSETDIFDRIGWISRLHVDALKNHIRKEVLIAREPFKWPEELSTIELWPSNLSILSDWQQTSLGDFHWVEMSSWRNDDFAALFDELQLGERSNWKSDDFDELQRGERSSWRSDEVFQLSTYLAQEDEYDFLISNEAFYAQWKEWSPGNYVSPELLKLRGKTFTITSKRLQAAGHDKVAISLYFVRHGRRQPLDQLCGPLVIMKAASNGTEDDRLLKPQSLTNGCTEILSLQGREMIKVEANLTVLPSGITWSLRLSDVQDDHHDSEISDQVRHPMSPVFKAMPIIQRTTF